MTRSPLRLLLAILLIAPSGGVSQAAAANNGNSVKPKVFSPSNDLEIKLVDPRTKKTINPLITRFWVNSNRLNYELYSNKEFDTYWESSHLVDFWTSLASKGYILEAAPNATNNMPKAMWLLTSIPGNNFQLVSPKGTSCEVLGSTLRFRASLYTCISVGAINQYDEGILFGSDHKNGVLGDGYLEGIDAPGRECKAEKAISNFYGATISCVLLFGKRYPQSAAAVTIMNGKNNKEIYCMAERTLAKQKQPLIGFKENVLITSSCGKFFGNKSAKY